MRFPKLSFDPETVALMGRVCDAAWERLRSTTYIPFPEDVSEVRDAIALKVMLAVSDGERDPERLVVAALEDIEG